MGRKRNNDNLVLGTTPMCPNAHQLERMEADADYECDACSVDLLNGTCYFGCAPCDYSLCGGCYVKLATGTLEGAVALANPSQDCASAAAHDDGRLDPDVAELCEHFEVEGRVMLRLNQVMRERQDTFGPDIEKLWEELRMARNPAGLLMAKIRQMQDGSFVGKRPTPKEVKRVIEKFRLDEDARTKLADFICKRPERLKEDLFEIERRLEGSGRPSAVVMTLLVKMHRGEKLPELQRSASHRDYGTLASRQKEYGEIVHHRGAASGDDSRSVGTDPRSRGGSRERRRSRSRSRGRRRPSG